MGFLKRLKNGQKLTAEQQFNSYAAPADAFSTKAQLAQKAKDEQQQQHAAETVVDEEQQRRQLNSSTETIRRVRELAREKYRLDVYVWSKRDTLESNRGLIMASCRRADAIRAELHGIVAAWTPDLFAPDEWAVARQIQAGVARCVREEPWAVVPPWYR